MKDTLTLLAIVFSLVLPTLLAAEPAPVLLLSVGDELRLKSTSPPTIHLIPVRTR